MCLHQYYIHGKRREHPVKIATLMLQTRKINIKRFSGKGCSYLMAPIEIHTSFSTNDQKVCFHDSVQLKKWLSTALLGNTDSNIISIAGFTLHERIYSPLVYFSISYQQWFCSIWLAFKCLHSAFSLAATEKVNSWQVNSLV